MNILGLHILTDRQLREIREQETEMANGCLDMIREELEAWGLPMQGCPPMFYNDAIHKLVVILAKAAPCTTPTEVKQLLANAQ